MRWLHISCAVLASVWPVAAHSYNGKTDNQFVADSQEELDAKWGQDVSSCANEPAVQI